MSQTNCAFENDTFRSPERVSFFHYLPFLYVPFLDQNVPLDLMFFSESQPAPPSSRFRSVTGTGLRSPFIPIVIGNHSETPGRPPASQPDYYIPHSAEGVREAFPGVFHWSKAEVKTPAMSSMPGVSKIIFNEARPIHPIPFIAIRFISFILRNELIFILRIQSNK